MFSLIITVISIALVAALALATLYYGGAAFMKGTGEAHASKIVLQGQQLLGAAEMYFTDYRVWPATMNDLVDGGYLTSIPVARAALGAAHASGIQWVMPSEGEPLFKLVSTLEQDACASVNQKSSLGERGILRDAYPELRAQCFGEEGYTVIFKMSTAADSLDRAGLPSGAVAAASIPASREDPAWTLPPQVAAAPGNGNTPGGGTPGVAVVDVSTTQLAFNAQSLNTQSPLVVTVSNTGNGLLSFTSAPALSGSGAFTVSANTCATTLAAGASCSLTVTFTPTALAEVTGTLSFEALSTTYEVALSGSGSGAVTQLSASALTFPSVYAGGASTATLTVSNTGNAALSFDQAPAVTGNSAFTLDSTTCGSSLAADAQCTITTRFAPVDTSAASADLTFTAGGAPYTIDLSATAAATPASAPSSSAFDAGGTGTGTTATISVAVTNSSASSVSLASVSSSNATVFPVTKGNCGTTLAAGASCNLSASFKPTVNGEQSATFTLLASDSNGNFSVQGLLTGTGRDPIAQNVTQYRMNVSGFEYGMPWAATKLQAGIDWCGGRGFNNCTWRRAPLGEGPACWSTIGEPGGANAWGQPDALCGYRNSDGAFSGLGGSMYSRQATVYN